jgi:hypothetical protein
MEHPWLLFVSVVIGAPLVWVTYELFFPNLREDLEDDGASLLVGVFTGWWPATWTFLKVLLFIVLTAAYIAAGYNVMVWMFK